MIGKFLELSTGHISEETMQLLERAGDRTQVAPETQDWPAMTIASYACGVFFTVPGDAELKQFRARAVIGVVPEDLAAILAYAKGEGASLVRLDADGHYVTGLATYTW